MLLLNTCLTVRAHEANSHANRGWERFTQRVIDLVAARRASGVVFMAWGTPAGKRVVKINPERHLVLKSVHPSPLSASRGFFDCGHFKKANAWLVARYGKGGDVDWSLGSTSSPPVQATTTTVVAKKTSLEEDEIDDDWAAEATAAIVEAESKVNVMGPPPTPSPKKDVKTTVKTPVKSQGEAGKENEKADIPA